MRHLVSVGLPRDAFIALGVILSVCLVVMIAVNTMRRKTSLHRLDVRQLTAPPGRRALASWLAGGFLVGLVYGIAVGVAGGFAGGTVVGLSTGLTFGLVGGLIFGLALGVSFGATYEEFSEAWSTTQGFGVPTRVLTAQRLDDPREILSIGFIDAAVEDLGSIAERSSENESQRHSRIDAVIDSTELRAFYVLRDEDDLS
jgi:hypothetical protein